MSMSGLETKSYPATTRPSKLACAVIPVSTTATTEPAPAESDTAPAFTPNSPAKCHASLPPKFWVRVRCVGSAAVNKN